MFSEKIYKCKKFVDGLKDYDLLPLLWDSKYFINEINFLDLKGYWKKRKVLLKEGKVSDYLQMYVHIPFCEEFCDYCVYYKMLLKDKYREQLVKDYIGYLKQVVDYFSYVFRDIEFKNISVGGGTPSILSAKEMESLFGYIFSKFKFSPYSYKGIEFRPSSTDETKLKTLRKLGFNVLHFGVQSLDTEVLNLMNRKKDLKDVVGQDIKLAKKYNFNKVVVHIIRGLYNDTVEKFIYTLDYLLKQGVSMISIYKLIPTNFYLKKFYNGDYQAFNKFLYSFSEKLIDRLFKLLKKYSNYRLVDSKGLIYEHSWTIEKKDIVPVYKYPYGDIVTQDVSLFSLGPSSRGYIQSVLSYEWIHKFDMNFDSSKIVIKARKIGVNFELFKYILINFRERDMISIKDIYYKYNINFYEENKEVIHFLHKIGKIEIKNQHIYLLEKNPKKRLIWILFLLDKYLQQEGIIENIY